MNPLKFNHHALLFVGGSPQSKRAEAEKQAEALLCAHHPQAQYLWNAKNHPDYFYIEPEEKNHAIKIDSIREVIIKLQKKPQHAAHQVVVIAPAEAMTTGAANALLKTLEEPVGSVLFILISEQPSRLLPTIRSRCQIRRFPVIDTQKTDPEFQKMYADLSQSLDTLRHPNSDVIKIAEAMAKMDLKSVLDAMYYVISDRLKKQSVDQQKKLFFYLDQLLIAKRHVDSNIAINAPLLLENLLLKWSEW